MTEADASTVDGFDYYFDETISHLNPNNEAGALVIEYLKQAKEKYQAVKEDFLEEKEKALEAERERIMKALNDLPIEHQACWETSSVEDIVRAKK